ncbi:unnamed protein product [Effrenium voratum]|nr:unnamed protein product [Effrenium voratum]
MSLWRLALAGLALAVNVAWLGELPKAPVEKPLSRGAPDDALLRALEAGDEERALEVLDSGDVSRLLRLRSRRRDCTPLMLASGATGRVFRRVAARLAGLGEAKAAHVGAAARSRGGATAAEYAAARGANELAKRLESLAREEVRETARQRCRCCGALVMRRPRIASLADRYRLGHHTNPLVRRFFQNHTAWQILMRPEFHVFHKARGFHKELSESLCVLDEIERWKPEVLAEGQDWHVLDLCCGKSLTSLLLAARAPKLQISAVDWVKPDQLPHYAEVGISSVEYVQQDILAKDGLSALEAQIRRIGRPTLVTGVHLCGTLSAQAVELFKQPSVRACILVPCCLPHLRDAPQCLKHLYRQSVADETQYLQWSRYLEGCLSASGAVRRSSAVHMRSSKRTVLLAVKE